MRDGGLWFFSESKYLFSLRGSANKRFSRQLVATLHYSTKTKCFQNILFLPMTETEIFSPSNLPTNSFLPKKNHGLPQPFKLNGWSLIMYKHRMCDTNVVECIIIIFLSFHNENPQIYGATTLTHNLSQSCGDYYSQTYTSVQLWPCSVSSDAHCKFVRKCWFMSRRRFVLIF